MSKLLTVFVSIFIALCAQITVALAQDNVLHDNTAALTAQVDHAANKLGRSGNRRDRIAATYFLHFEDVDAVSFVR